MGWLEPRGTPPRSPHLTDRKVPAAGGDLTSLGLTITTTPVPGSLPRLRYLSDYRLRVRPVDLAGNALRPADANLMLQILEAAADPALRSAIPPEPLIYRRFEPVPAPELLPRRPFGPGEGLEQARHPQHPRGRCRRLCRRQPGERYSVPALPRNLRPPPCRSQGVTADGRDPRAARRGHRRRKEHRRRRRRRCSRSPAVRRGRKGERQLPETIRRLSSSKPATTLASRRATCA